MGLTTDKNCLGQIAMCSGVFFTWDVLRNWTKQKLSLDLLLIVLTLWLLRVRRTPTAAQLLLDLSQVLRFCLGCSSLRKELPALSESFLWERCWSS